MIKRVFLGLLTLCFTPILFAITSSDTPIKVTLLADITPQGQKITAVALEYEDIILAGDNLAPLYQIQTQLDQHPLISRTITRAYSNNQAARSFRPQSGKFVIIELQATDENAMLYDLIKANETPIKVRERNSTGHIQLVEKTQISRSPQYYHQRLTYHITQQGYLTLAKGKTISPTYWQQSADPTIVKTPWLDEFIPKQVTLQKDNYLAYRLYVPKKKPNKSYPLTIFLHGSGQVGQDNLAHLLSSKGAIATLAYEEGFVLAPQYQQIFDPFDQGNGIHWQTDNRQNLLLTMLDKTLSEYPNIDRNRIYLIGLSRGAEGAVKLLQKRPHFFAGALLTSGREAETLEWIDGNATMESLAPLKNIPIWIFHSTEDKISPVAGSRRNYQILQSLNAPNIRYSELTFQQVGDNGIVNNNAHNSWDMVFDSPYIMQWLLEQNLSELKYN